MRTLRIETKTKVSPRRFSARERPRWFDSISRFEPLLKRRQMHESIETRHKFYSSKSFPRSKINRTGDRKDKLSIDYSSRSWLSVNYERMATRNRLVFEKTRVGERSSVFQTRSFPPPLCFLNIERATSFAREQEFDSLFCFGNPRISARRVSNR